MLTRTCLTVVLSFITAIRALGSDSRLATALELYRAGDLDGALERLEPLLISNDGDEPSRQRAPELAGRILHSRGEAFFRQARITEAISDFDRQIKLQPEQAAGHWQRGIAYYYAGEYDKGVKQFELHRTINPQDVENAAWHFLCVIRAPRGTIERARSSLIPVTRDSRIPMSQVQDLFAGKTTPEEVLRVGKEAGDTAKFYADLYVGLYYEALDQKAEALQLIARAADNPAARNNYRGDVARVHVILRKKSASSTQVRRTDSP